MSAHTYTGDDATGVPPEYSNAPHRADVAGSRGGVGNLTKNPGMVPTGAEAQAAVPPSALRGLHYGTDAATGYAGPGTVPAGGAGAGAEYEHDAQYGPGQGQGHSMDGRKPGSGAGNKPSAGQRIVGEIEKFAGKLMEDSEMVALGKQRTVSLIIVILSIRGMSLMFVITVGWTDSYEQGHGDWEC